MHFIAKNDSVLNYFKINKRINKINRRNICICFNEIVVKSRYTFATVATMVQQKIPIVFV
jgi:hypothetical protein